MSVDFGLILGYLGPCVVCNLGLISVDYLQRKQSQPNSANESACTKYEVGYAKNKTRRMAVAHCEISSRYNL